MQIPTLIAMARFVGWGEISYWPGLDQVLTSGDGTYRNLTAYRWAGQKRRDGMVSGQNER